MDIKSKKRQTPLNYLLIGLVVIVAAIVLSDPINNFVHAQLKSMSLRAFYTQLSTAENNKNWSMLYDFLPNSTRRYVSREQYVSFQSKKPNQPYSSKTTINSLTVNGDNGVINRTTIQCLTSDCAGSKRKVDTADRSYVYQNDRWKIPEVEPSEKALNLAYFMYNNSGTKADQQKAVNNWGNFGIINPDYSVHNFAIVLDYDSSEMAKAENWVETYKANQNKPVIIQRQIPMPVYNPPRLVVPPAQQIKTTHCTPDFFGGGVTCTTY